ncbi:MAG: biotin-dependent carboxyltransferase family protein [Gemmatimonadales bacterium]
MIVVSRAPAYATVQDTGRIGFRSSGVPRAGAMDPQALSTLNVLLGNDATAAGIELALTGGELEFTAAATIAIGGAEASATLNAAPVEEYRAHRAAAGDVLSVQGITRGRFLYIAVAGGIDIPFVLRSRSTYVPGAFGGVEGRRLKVGDSLPIGAAVPRRRHQVTDPLPVALRPLRERDTVRFVPRGDAGPSIDGTFVVSPASDRTGYRLLGSPRDDGASITSEPVCPGTIQLPPGGEAIVLMAEAPTIGGYRIMGAVAGADLGVLAQRLPGETIVLEPITVERAQREAERRAETLSRVGEWGLA